MKYDKNHVEEKQIHYSLIDIQSITNGVMC